MFWFGDSAWPYRFKRIPREINQGIHDNIPLCCTLWYSLAVLASFLISTLARTLLREEIGQGFTADFFVFSKLMSGKLDKKKRLFHSNDFAKLQYWRCPICRITGKRNKLRWDTGIYWED